MNIFFKRGTQIAYIPTHVLNKGGDAWKTDKDTEFGFVWLDEMNGTVRCRYFSKYGEGQYLRTRANSERTPKENLAIHVSRDQSIIDNWVKIIEKENNVV